MENHALEQLEQTPGLAAENPETTFAQADRRGRRSLQERMEVGADRRGRRSLQGRMEVGADCRGRRSLQAQACSGGETQAVARKLLRRVEMVLDGEEALNPQAMKHISGILKDVRDILTVREDSVDSGAVTVEMEKSVEEFAG